MYNPEAPRIGRSEDRNPSGRTDGFRSSDLALCVRCAGCKAACPTLEAFANEGMGARGRMALLHEYLTGRIDASDALAEKLETCLLCGACDSACPLGIPVTEAVYEGRRRLASERKGHRLIGQVFRRAFLNPSNTSGLLRLAHKAARSSLLGSLQPLRVLRELSLPLPASRLHDGASIFKVQNPKGRIALFTGCTIDFIYPSMGASFIRALNAFGYEVVLPKGEVCCGAPLLGMGMRDEAAALAERNLDAFSKLQAEAVVSLCPTCVHFIRDRYRSLAGQGIDKAMDSAALLDELAQAGGITPVRDERRIMYHAPCHSVNHLGIRNEPGRVLEALGYRVSEPAEKGCCGFGGTVRLLHDHVSKAVLERRVEAYREADVLVTSCPNCILHLSSALAGTPVRHLAELVAERLQGR